MSKMDTRKKLSEAKFFLDKLSYATDASDFTKVNYFLSAFLSAWRSVLDIMLYDFCEYFSLGLTREEKVDDRIFIAMARHLKKTKAVEFLIWWKQKQGILANNPLWKQRTLAVHRGSLSLETIVYYYPMDSGGNSSTMSGFVRPWAASGDLSTPLSHLAPYRYNEVYNQVFSFSDDPKNTNILYVCQDGLTEMDVIVEEAEAKFWVKL